MTRNAQTRDREFCFFTSSSDGARHSPSTSSHGCTWKLGVNLPGVVSKLDYSAAPRATALTGSPLLTDLVCFPLPCH
jgi:hypothetical protein